MPSTMQLEPRWRAYFAAFCLCCVMGSCACDQPANKEKISAADRAPNDLLVLDKKPDLGKQGSEARRQIIEGDDISIGLEASVRLLDPSYDTGGDTRGGVADRDEKMRQLKAFIASRPASSTPIECLVGDAAFDAHGCMHHQSGVRIYYAKVISREDILAMASLGFVRVGERDWWTMRPWMLRAATRIEPRLTRVFDIWDVLVFSYYDGKQWRIAPWFYLTFVPENYDATETDMAILQLIEYLNCKMQPPVPFAEHYRTHLLFRSEWRAIYEEDIKSRRMQEAAPEKKPERLPETKTPVVK